MFRLLPLLAPSLILALAAPPAVGQLNNGVLNRPVVVDSTNGPTVPG
jgi:hypothetical protein